MADTTTSIIITAKDQTAAAFSSVNNSLSGLAGGALKVTGALSALGATAAAGSFVAFTKNVLEAQDNLFKLSQKTGLAVESLAGLEFAAEQSGVELDKVAKATRVFRELVVEAADASSGAAKKLDQLGLKYQDLKDLSPEKQLLALSDALSKFSKDDRPIAFTSIFGQKMADLIPLLNNGSKELAELIEQGKKLNPVTEASAKQAEKFNDQINLLSKNVSSLGREFVQGMIPGLSAVSTKMVEVTQQSGLLAGALAGVKELFVQSFGNPKILGEVGQIRREIFKTQGVINGLEKKRGSFFFDENALLHEKEKLVALQNDLQGAIVKSRDVVAAQDSNTESTKRFTAAVESTNKPLAVRAEKVDLLAKKMADQSRIESEYVKLLVIERKAQADLLKPYQDSAKSAQDRLVSMQQELKALDLSRDKQISLEQAIELTTIARLEEKKSITKDSTAVAEIDKEIAARKQIIGVIQQTESRTKALATVNQQAADQTTQFWIQANRSIQSALATGIFDAFNDGLDGMVRNVKTTVLRIISEFAALKLLERAGGLFGGASSVGTGGQTVGWLSSLAGAFGASRGMQTGGGVTTGAFSNAGGAGTAFIGGKGTALGGSGMGVSATRSSNMGSLMSLGALAGPYGIAAAAAIMVGMELDKKYGDYKVSGFNKFGMNGLNKTDPIAVVANQFGIKGPGEILGKFLFGRGPYKFRQQSLQGDISSSGLDGTLTDVFRSKGGLLVNNKHKSFENDIPSEIVRDIDKSIKDIFKSTHVFAKNLGIDAQSIDSFTKEIQIKSEKGKALTTEAVKEMLSGFNEDLIKTIMPDIDSFKLTGESAGETFARLNKELDTLKSAVQSLGGSASFAKDLINGMSIDTRSALIDMAGGIDALVEKANFFSENFLTASQQLAPTIAMVKEEMAKLGLESVTTKEQFKAMVQSLDISAETRNALLDLAPAFLQIIDVTKQIKDSVNQDTLALAGGFAPEKVLGIKFNLADEALSEFGLSADTSREKLTGLLREFVMSGGLYTDIADKVKEAAAVYKDYINSLDANNQDLAQEAMSNLGSAFTALQTTIDSERSKATDKYNSELQRINDSISTITDNVSQLKTVSSALKTTLNSINPLSLEDARSQISAAIASSKKGNVIDLESVRNALDTLGQKDTKGFSDRTEFLLSQGKNTSLINQLSSATDKQLSMEEKSLKALEDSRDVLKSKFEQQLKSLDDIAKKAQEQVNGINGVSDAILTLSSAIANFDKAITGARGATSAPQPSASKGNPNITKKDIVDFASKNTPMKIYLKARELGVSSEQIVQSGVATRAEVDKFLKDNKLPSFDVGGVVPSTGLALVHKGERVINPQQNEAIVKLLQDLIAIARAGSISSNDTYKLLRDMSNGSAMKTAAA